MLNQISKKRQTAWMIAGVLVIAANLRPAITSMPPIFRELRHDLHLPPIAITVLATVPVLCFGLCSFGVARFAARFGDERVLGVALLILTVGLVLRPLCGAASLFVGTVLATTSIAALNVLLSSLIKRRMPDKAGKVLGWYMLVYSLGVLTGSAVSVPLYTASSGSLGVTMGLWAIPAALAFLVWLPQLRRRTPAEPGVRRAMVYRQPLAWQVALFMGAQSLTYYAVTSFLPELFRDRGVGAEHAGFLAMTMGLGGLAVAYAIPVLAGRRSDQRLLVFIAALLIAFGLVGCVFAPVSTAALWVVLLGAGQGCAQPLGLYFAIARSKDAETAAALSGMSQGVGYLIALLGPLSAGLLRSLTGGWLVPVLGLLAVTIATFALGMLAGRDRTISARLPSMCEPAGAHSD